MNKAIKGFITSYVAIFVAATVCIGSLSSMAYASGYDWTSWSVGPTTQNCRPVRQKYTSSSLFVKNTTQYASHGVYFSIFGSNVNGTSDPHPVRTCSQYSEVLNTYDLWIPGNCERRVRQYIYENNYTYALPHFKYNQISASSGFWSPDLNNESGYISVN